MSEVASVLGGAGLLAGSWVLVTQHEVVPRWEARLFEAVNDWPDALWPVIWPPMQLGSLVGSLLVAGAAGLRTRDRRLAVACVGASQAGYWLAKGVKNVARRGRPGDLLEGVHVRENASGLGYVSGHAAVAFGSATVLSPSMPTTWRPIALAAAVVVAVGRVYAGAHLPLDVFGGIGFGLLLGTLARWMLGLGGEGLPPVT